MKTSYLRFSEIQAEHTNVPNLPKLVKIKNPLLNVDLFKFLFKFLFHFRIF